MAKERVLTGKWEGFFPGDWVRPRSNPGTWMPLVDVAEVFPGNRSVSRQGVYNLYDAPIGVELKIEEATKAPIIFEGEAEWESEGVSPGDSLDQAVTWQGNSDISGVGEMVAIRLKMFQAKVFAYRV